LLYIADIVMVAMLPVFSGGTMRTRTVVVRERVAQAVAGWHALQKMGTLVTASEAADAVRAMYAMPEVGSGPAIVAMLLVDNHGWERDGRKLWLPPKMPVKLATPAPVTMTAPVAVPAPDFIGPPTREEHEAARVASIAKFKSRLRPAPPSLPGELI
jgi:hypothetical protein